MTRPLAFRPQARAELLEARAWYEAEKPGLGGAFLTEVRAAVSLLREMPEAFPAVYHSIRRLLLKRFPYALYFVVEDGVVVVVPLSTVAVTPQFGSRALKADYRIKVTRLGQRFAGERPSRASGALPCP